MLATAVDPGHRSSLRADLSFHHFRARSSTADYSRGYMYTPQQQPQPQALEQGVSALEGGAAAAAFASGMAAAMALFQALAPGDHVLAHVDAYYGMTRLLRDLFRRWGLEADFVDMSDLDAGATGAASEHEAGLVETPPIRCLKSSISRRSPKSSRDAGALSVCDNTWAPVIQRPFDLGCDLILHSTTKYFGGHCDVLGGIVVAKKRWRIFRASSGDPIFRRARSPRLSIAG